MQPAHVKNVFKISATGVTYHVMAYRRLTDQELQAAVAAHLRQQGRGKRAKKVRPGPVVRIETIHGAAPGI